MARPLKQGIDYFPYDVDLDQDDKLGMIIGEFEHKGERAYTKLLCWIYKHEGYYTSWEEDVQLRFMRRYSYCGFSLSFVNEVVQRCLKWGLFDQDVFDAFQILTSSRIQETWLQASRQRIGRVYIPKYWLIDVSTALQPLQTELITGVIDKGKESKQKEKKREVLALAVPAPAILPVTDPLINDPPAKKNAGAKKFVAPEAQEVKDFFLRVIGNPRKPGHWPADKCENEAGKYFNHYTANGWKQGRGKPIVDWQAAGRNWITNEREGAFSNSPAAPAGRSVVQIEAKPVLSKIDLEINYLYETYCEDASKVTIISVDPLHYNHLKNSGLVNFDENSVAEIKNEVSSYLAGMKIQENETVVLKFMKKFGVIQFFKQRAAQGKEAVFSI